MQLLEDAAVGVRLTASTPLEDVWVEVLAAEETALVVVFEAFRDGRGFSLASTLRERGWTGRLIAAGDLLPDQARHLNRAGFDAVELAPGADPETWHRMLAAFTTVYQAATDTAVPAWRRRTERTATTDLEGSGKGTWVRVEGGIGGGTKGGPLISAWADFGDTRGYGLRAGFRF